MKKVLIAFLASVLFLCQICWGGIQNEPEDLVGGLFDIILEVVTAPCGLLATCLGLDSGPCAPQCPMPCCAASGGYCRCPCCGRPMKSMVAHSVPVARPFSHKNKSEPVKSVEPLLPVKKLGTEAPTPAIIRSFPEPARFTEPKAQTAPPAAPEMSNAPSTASGMVASPPEPLPQRAPETETTPQKVEIRPKLPEVIPLAPSNVAPPPKEKSQEVKKPVEVERKEPVVNIQTTPPPATEIVAEKNVVKPKESVKEPTKKPSKAKKRPCGPIYPPACGPRLWYR
ncbi:MAG: hypothetical protein V1897_09870 [Pseudomonadota bacterium]